MPLLLYPPHLQESVGVGSVLVVCDELVTGELVRRIRQEVLAQVVRLQVFVEFMTDVVRVG